MKYLYISLLVLLTGCTTNQNPKETAILNYIQTIDGVKTDLNADIMELTFTRNMVGMDSAILLYAQYRQNQSLNTPEQNIALLEQSEAYQGKEKIAEYWFCRYRINNPILNAEQEVSTVFIFQGDHVAGTMGKGFYEELTREVETALKE